MGYSIFEETMADMTYLEIERAAREHASILLPVAVIEEHGPHLCLGTDVYLTYELCRKVRRNLAGKGVQTLIAPPFYWGINFITGDFAGSFTARRSTMKALLADILGSLRRWGFENVFLLNLHGDPEHGLTILEAIHEARVEGGVRAYAVLEPFNIKRFGLSGKEPHVLVHSTGCESSHSDEYMDVHAGAFETSLMVADFPDLVDQGLARSLESSRTSMEDFQVWRRGWSDTRRVTPLGYCGDPSRIDAEDARKGMEAHVESLSGTIAACLDGTYVPL